MAKKVVQPSARSIANRINGKKGGLARAAKLSKEQRSAISKKAGTTTSLAYGSEYYSLIASKRVNPGPKRKKKPV